ncbi:hypothetical protein D3C76_1804650 [compost metagenome]
MNSCAGQRMKNHRLRVIRHSRKPQVRPMRFETSASSRVTLSPSSSAGKLPLRKWKSNW